MKHPAELHYKESFWLQNAKLDLLQRDPVAAVKDAKALVEFAQRHLRATQKSKTNAWKDVRSDGP